MNSNDRWEEGYYKEDKKSLRKERKLASQADRSKYKKTDQDKIQKSHELHSNIKRDKDSFLRGRVISISSSGIHVDYEGKELLCGLRGLLKKERTQDKNLITVGDFVLFEQTAPGEGQVAHIEPRFSILSRADNLSRRKQQLIAANIDQVIITSSIGEPPLKPFLIDRYIIAASKGGMEAVIVVNKMDLLENESPEAQEYYHEFVKAYTKAGYRIIPLSIKTGEGIEALKEAMKDKASVFSGQSGVGKTSLINLVTGLDMKTREVVGKTGKGSHTTTSTRLIPLVFGGFCIDTPGIKSFGVWNLDIREIASYFPDISKYGQKCHFPDCSHLHEDNCAVIKALKMRQLPAIRYESYALLLASLKEEHLRR